MQQMIVDIVVAAAILFLASWLFRSFVAKRQTKESCGSCPQCASQAKTVTQPESGAARSEG